MDLPPQKGFYDSHRQFQGNDDPRSGDAPAPEPAGAEKPPLAQLVTGAIFLALIAVAFFAFALPPKPVGLDGKKPATQAPKAPPAR